MTYQLSRYDGVILIKDNERVCIPFDEANTDFVEYQKWLSEGNQPLPADEPNV